MEEPRRLTVEQWRHYFNTPGIELTAEELTASGCLTLLRTGSVSEWEHAIRAEGASLNVMDVIALATMMGDVRANETLKIVEDIRARIHLLDLWLDETFGDKGYRSSRALRVLAEYKDGEGSEDARRSSKATEGTDRAPGAISERTDGDGRAPGAEPTGPDADGGTDRTGSPAQGSD